MKLHLLASPICFSSPSLFLSFFLSLCLSILTSLRLAHFLCIQFLDFLFIFPSLSLSLKLWPCSLIHSQPLSLLFFHFLSSTESFYIDEATLLSARPWLSNTSYWRRTLNAGMRRREDTEMEKSQMTSQFFLTDSIEIAWRSNGDFYLETEDTPFISHVSNSSQKCNQRGFQYIPNLNLHLILLRFHCVVNNWVYSNVSKKEF